MEAMRDDTDQKRDGLSKKCGPGGGRARNCEWGFLGWLRQICRRMNESFCAECAGHSNDSTCDIVKIMIRKQVHEKFYVVEKYMPKKPHIIAFVSNTKFAQNVKESTCDNAKNIICKQTENLHCRKISAKKSITASPNRKFAQNQKWAITQEIYQLVSAALVDHLALYSSHHRSLTVLILAW